MGEVLTEAKPTEQQNEAVKTDPKITQALEYYKQMQDKSQATKVLDLMDNIREINSKTKTDLSILEPELPHDEAVVKVETNYEKSLQAFTHAVCDIFKSRKGILPLPYLEYLLEAKSEMNEAEKITHAGKMLELSEGDAAILKDNIAKHIKFAILGKDKTNEFEQLLGYIKPPPVNAVADAKPVEILP